MKLDKKKKKKKKCNYDITELLLSLYFIFQCFFQAL